MSILKSLKNRMSHKSTSRIRESEDIAIRNNISNERVLRNIISNETNHRYNLSNETATRNSATNETAAKNSATNETATRNSATNETATRSSAANETATRSSATNETATRNSAANETTSINEASHRIYPSSSISFEASCNNEMTNGRSCSMISSHVVMSKQTSGTAETRTRGHGNEVETDGPSLEILPNDMRRVKAVPSIQTSVECTKHPGHKEFIPIRDLKINHLPQPYQSQDWVHFIQLKGMDTVLVEVNYTSPDRPDDLGFVAFKGTTKKRTGSGTAFVMNMDKYEDCNCSEISGTHNISGCFTVMTVSHVVFNDEEAQNTVVTFFYEDENDMSTVVKARGVRIMHVDVQKNRSLIECRTHDLNLHQRLLQAQQKRLRLAQNSLADEVNHEPMALLISHPHGLSKRVSIGKLLSIEEDGQIKTNKDGVELIGCFLTYDTPTCPGTGGGSLNLIGNGEVCSAFAPHCASKSNGTNISGLGWTKYIKTMQIRVSY